MLSRRIKRCVFTSVIIKHVGTDVHVHNPISARMKLQAHSFVVAGAVAILRLRQQGGGGGVRGQHTQGSWEVENQQEWEAVQ